MKTIKILWLVFCTVVLADVKKGLAKESGFDVAPRIVGAKSHFEPNLPKNNKVLLADNSTMRIRILRGSKKCICCAIRRLSGGIEYNLDKVKTKKF